jgi:Rieske Fe-S protein
VQQHEYAALAAEGGAVKVANPFGGKPIIVIRISDTEVGAFSSKCPHLGCEVSLPEAGIMTCPCHGSTFNESGRVTHGPSIRDLHRYVATINGTVITISNERAA